MRGLLDAALFHLLGEPVEGRLQKLLQPFRLNPAIYYVDHVPVDIGVWLVLAINLAVIAISFAVFLIPSIMISRVNPTKTMKFD